MKYGGLMTQVTKADLLLENIKSELNRLQYLRTCETDPKRVSLFDADIEKLKNDAHRIVGIGKGGRA